MTQVLPFRAYRPKPGLEADIASLPYDVFDRQEAKEYVKNKPLSFLNIDRPETAFSLETYMYSQEIYDHAKFVLDKMISDGNFVQDSKECFYIYQQTFNGLVQTGIVGLSSIWDYKNNIVKKHELTRKEKELDRINHIKTTKMQTGPIFLAHKHSDEISQIKKKYIDFVDPDFIFTSDMGVNNAGWIVSDNQDIKALKKAFSQLECTYIADGHHRCASAVKVGLNLAKENKNHTGQEEYNNFLSVLFDSDDLKIMDYNRVVLDLNGLDKDKFLRLISKNFDIEKSDSKISPDKPKTFGMYLQDKWFKLTYKGKTENDPVKSLDVSILQDNLLDPILGIKDPQTDSRIDFVGGIRGLTELEKRVKNGAAVSFSMFPTSMEQLFAVADAGLLMPPKSTWFEPKLLSGLFLHQI